MYSAGYRFDRNVLEHVSLTTYWERMKKEKVSLSVRVFVDARWSRSMLVFMERKCQIWHFFV